MMSSASLRRAASLYCPHFSIALDTFVTAWRSSADTLGSANLPSLRSGSTYTSWALRRSDCVFSCLVCPKAVKTKRRSPTQRALHGLMYDLLRLSELEHLVTLAMQH